MPLAAFPTRHPLPGHLPATTPPFPLGGFCSPGPGEGAASVMGVGRIHVSSAKNLIKGAQTGNQFFKAEINNHK